MNAERRKAVDEIASKIDALDNSMSELETTADALREIAQ